MITSGVEAAGDVMTGAILGRAVEPTHGEDSTAGHGNCLNCGTKVIGTHCHQCGQATHVHRTLHAYGHDLLHSVFHFEGKIWTTLPMLAFKPGELTRRYIHGERAKFVSPLALFLFATFLMFAVVSGLAGEMRAPEISAADRAKSLPEIERGITKKQAEKTGIDRQITAIEARDGNTEALEKRSDALDTEIDALKGVRSLMKGEKWNAIGVFNTNWPTLNNAIKKANENPNLLLYKLQSSAYKYSWALIPLSTPFVWALFFWRRQYKLYDHAVFVTYSLTFMLFLAVTLTVLGFAGIGDAFVSIAGTFVPPLHMYRQLRGAYGVGRFGGIVRTLALSVFGLFALMLFLVLLLLLGIMG